MTKDALYKEDRVYVPESHLEETLRWSHTVNGHPAVQRSLWFFDRHFHCNKNESEKKRLMTKVTKDCHCILGNPNIDLYPFFKQSLQHGFAIRLLVHREDPRESAEPARDHQRKVVPGIVGQVHEVQVHDRVYHMRYGQVSHFSAIDLTGLPKVIHSDQDVRFTAAGNWYRGVLETLGCEIQFGTPYPRTKNALCERQIRSFKTVMRILMGQEKGRNWLRVLCTHIGRPRDRKEPMGRTHWGDPADPPGQWQERYSKATGLSPARLHRGPWQTSPGAMEATGDRRAGTQSRRGSPAKQSGPATQATRVRRTYRRQAGAIPVVVRDTPHGWAAPQSCRPKEGACGPTHGHMWGHPPTWDTWTRWPRQCLPKHMRERLKRHLT